MDLGAVVTVTIQAVFDEFKSAIEEVKNTTQQVAEEIKNKTSEALSEFENKATESAKTTSEKLKKLGENFKEAGETLTKSVTLPLTALGGVAIAAANDIDNAMDNIRAGTGATGEALEGLGVVLRQVLAEIPTSANNASIAISELNTRFGLTGDALKAVTEHVLEFARLTNTDVATAVKGVSDVFATWNVQVSEMTDVLNYLWNVSQSTGISMQELNDALTKGAPVFQQLGMSISEAAAFIGMLDKAGIDAGTSIVALRTAMAKLTEEAIKQNIPVQELLRQKFEDLRNGTLSLEQTIQIFGGRVGATLYKMAQDGTLSFEAFEKALKSSNETIMKASEDARSFGEIMTLLKNKVELALEPLGVRLLDAFDRLLPVLDRALNFLAGLIEKFANLPPAVQDTILVIGGLAVALGPVLAAIGNMIETMQKLGNVFSMLSGAASPIGATILVITGLVTVATLVITHWDEVKRFFSELWDKIKELTKAAVDTISGWIKSFVEAVVGFYTDLKNRVVSIVTGFVEKVKELFNNMVTGVKEIVGGMVEAVKNFFAGLWNSVKDFVTGFVNNVVGKFGELKTNISNIIGAIKDNIVKFFAGLWNTIKDTLANFVNNVVNKFGEMKDKVLNFVSATVEGIKNWFSGLWDKVKNGVGDFVEKTKNAFKDLWDKLVGHSIVPDTVDAVVYHFTRMNGEVVAIVEDTKQKVVSKFEEKKQEVTTTTKALADGVKTHYNEMSKAITDHTAATTQNIAQKHQEAKQDIVNTHQSLKQELEIIHTELYSTLERITIEGIQKLLRQWDEFILKSKENFSLFADEAERATKRIIDAQIEMLETLGLAVKALVDTVQVKKYQETMQSLAKITEEERLAYAKELFELLEVSEDGFDTLQKVIKEKLNGTQTTLGTFMNNLETTVGKLEGNLKSISEAVLSLTAETNQTSEQLEKFVTELSGVIDINEEIARSFNRTKTEIATSSEQMRITLTEVLSEGFDQTVDNFDWGTQQIVAAIIGTNRFLTEFTQETVQKFRYIITELENLYNVAENGAYQAGTGFEWLYSLLDQLEKNIEDTTKKLEDSATVIQQLGWSMREPFIAASGNEPTLFTQISEGIEGVIEGVRGIELLPFEYHKDMVQGLMEALRELPLEVKNNTEEMLAQTIKVVRQLEIAYGLLEDNTGNTVYEVLSKLENMNNGIEGVLAEISEEVKNATFEVYEPVQQLTDSVQKQIVATTDTVMTQYAMINEGTDQFIVTQYTLWDKFIDWWKDNAKTINEVLNQTFQNAAATFVRFLDEVAAGKKTFSDFKDVVKEFLLQTLSALEIQVLAYQAAGIATAIAQAPATLGASLSAIPQILAQTAATLAIFETLKAGVRAMAEGGIVTKPTLALIGEAGAEAVIPLEKLGNFGKTEVHLHIGTLIADEFGLLELQRRLQQVSVYNVRR